MSITHRIIAEAVAEDRKHRKENPDQYIKGMIWRQKTEQDMQQAWNSIPEIAQTEEVKRTIFANVGSWEPASVPEHGHICTRHGIKKTIYQIQQILGQGNYEWRPLQ